MTLRHFSMHFIVEFGDGLSSTNSAQGTTCSICSRSTCLRVFLELSFKGKAACFIGKDFCSFTRSLADYTGTFAEFH